MNQKSTYLITVQRVASSCECDTDDNVEWAGELHKRTINLVVCDGKRTVIITQGIDNWCLSVSIERLANIASNQGGTAGTHLVLGNG